MKVLVFAPHAAIWIHAFPEALVAEALSRAGHQIVYVTCDGLFSRYCVPMSASGLRYDGPETARKATCERCRANGGTLRAEFGFDGPSLAAQVTESDRQAVRAFLEGVTRENFRAVTFDGLEVGRFALYQFLILRKKIGLDFGDEEWREYLVHLEMTAIATAVMARVMAREKPDRVLVYNGLYSVNMACRALAARHGALAYFLHAGGNLAHRLQTLMLGREHTFRFYPALIRRWPDYANAPIPQERMRPATDHFVELLRGRSAFAYSATKNAGGFSVRERFGIGPAQRILVAAMGSYDEEFAAEAVGARVHDRPPLFADQAQWISALLRHVAARPDLFLIVRVHPREMPNRREGVKSEHAGLLESLLVDLPANAAVNWPTDGISLYDLAEDADAFLNSWSSVGKEMSLLGRAVVTYGKDIIFYPPELNYTAETVDGYMAQIDRALADGWSADRIRSTYRWLAVEYGAGLIDIGDSYAEREHAERPLMARVGRRVARAIDPQAEQRRDCRRRAPVLGAGATIASIVTSGAETVLDVMDAPAGAASETQEWSALRHEIGRLLPHLYPGGGHPRAGSLHAHLKAFVAGEMR